MKKIFLKLSLLAALVGGVSLTSCESLDLTPQDYFGSGNFWKNESQVNSYMIGIHSKFRDRVLDLYWLGEPRAKLMRSGTCTMGASLNRSNFIESTLSQASPGFDKWANMYSPIFDCNLFIQEVEAMDSKIMTAASKNKYLAQAYGMRAYFYFVLLKTYGGVPLVTKADALTETDINKMYLARSTQEQTMALIKDDLKKSDDFYVADNFSNVPGRCFWNKAATRMLMGEVYLWSAKAQKSSLNTTELNTALAALESIPTGTYGLMDKFLDVFTYENKGNKEIILSMFYDLNSYLSNGDDKDYVGRMVYAAAGWGGWQKRDGTLIENDTLDLTGKGIQRLEYKWDLFEAYEDVDVRKRTNFMDIYDCLDKDGKLNPVGDDGLPKISKKTFLQRKYLGAKNAGGVRFFCDDYIIYRYADLLLTKAEIKNALGQDPSAEINAIRERAYRTPQGVAQPYPVYTNGDFTTNELAIYFERVKELVLEGKSWYDLVRMQVTPGGMPLAFYAPAGIDGKAVLDKDTESYKLNWPISNDVLTNNKLVEQNPSWPKF